MIALHHVAGRPCSGGGSLKKVRRTLRSAKNRFTHHTKSRPVATATATGMGIGAVSDYVAQRTEGKTWETLDGRRIVGMACFSAFYGGVIYSQLFRWYDKVFTTATLGTGAKGVIAFKTLFDNLLVTPLLYFPIFYLTTGGIRGKSLDEITNHGQEHYIDNNVSSCAIWIPCNAIGFMVPLHLRVYFCYGCSLVWQTLLSSLSNAPEAPPELADLHEQLALASASQEAQCDHEKVVGDETTWLVSVDGEENRELRGTQCTGTAEQEMRVVMDCDGHLRTARDSECLRTNYRAECAVGLETMGNKLDAWMKEHLDLGTDKWQEVTRYRSAYRKFRCGEAHGCKGETLMDDLQHAQLDPEGEAYRAQYRSFRTGKPHGCRTDSSMAAVCA